MLSWSFVILPRFLQQIKQMREPLSFVGSPLNSWLYLMTRNDQEEVHVTSELVAKDPVIATAFHRMANLNHHETIELQNNIDEYVARMSREAESMAEGKAEGKAEVKAEVKAEGKAEGISEGIELAVTAIQMLREKRKAEDVALETGLPLPKVQRLQADFAP